MAHSKHLPFIYIYGHSVSLSPFWISYRGYKRHTFMVGNFLFVGQEVVERYNFALSFRQADIVSKTFAFHKFLVYCLLRTRVKQKLSTLNMNIVGEYRRSPAHAQRDALGRTICWFYQRGECRFGARCRFSHGEAISPTTQSPKQHNQIRNNVRPRNQRVSSMCDYFSNSGS